MDIFTVLVTGLMLWVQIRIHGLQEHNEYLAEEVDKWQTLALLNRRRSTKQPANSIGCFWLLLGLGFAVWVMGFSLNL